MFLQPSEVGFLKHLKEARVPVVEFEFPASKIVNVQSQLEKLIGQNYYLNKVRPFSSSLSLSPSLSVLCKLNTYESNSPQKTAIAPTSKRTPPTPSAPSSTSTNSISSK